jgi:hypothetical protein
VPFNKTFSKIPQKILMGQSMWPIPPSPTPKALGYIIIDIKNVDE